MDTYYKLIGLRFYILFYMSMIIFGTAVYLYSKIITIISPYFSVCNFIILVFSLLFIIMVFFIPFYHGIANWIYFYKSEFFITNEKIFYKKGDVKIKFRLNDIKCIEYYKSYHNWDNFSYSKVELKNGNYFYFDTSTSKSGEILKYLQAQISCVKSKKFLIPSWTFDKHA